MNSETQMTQSGTHISLEKEEYDRLKKLDVLIFKQDLEIARLKRLDENVQRKVIKLKKDDSDYSAIEPDEYDEVRQRIKYEIELLESLYK